MINEKIISVLGDAKDAFISESMPGITAAGSQKRARRNKRLMAAIIAASLVLICGVAAYAAGVFTAPFSIYKSAEAEVKNRKMTIDGVEVEFIDVDILVPVVDQKEIRGQIRTDITELMQEIKDIETPAEDWIRLSKEGQYGCIDSDYYEVSGEKLFEDQKTALNYIGYSNYREQYFPYDKYNVLVTYFAVLEKNGKTDNPDITDCGYQISSTDDKRVSITLQANSFFVYKIPKDKERGICYTGMGSYPADGSVTVETFTNAHGYNGAKAYTNKSYSESPLRPFTEGSGKYSIDGGIVKDNVMYSISIRCVWADKTEAEQIFTDWAEHF